MNRVIKIFEDTQQKVDLSEQEKDDILSIKKIIGENNVILQADNKLLIRHYVGFVQVNKTRILIYPKISREASYEEGYDKSFKILTKLLSYSDFYGVKKISSTQGFESCNDDLLELFIRLFVDEILFEFKRDINRGYNKRIENQSFIKGKVDFSETIKRNSFKKHIHFVNYDEFDENTILNQIFKSIIQRLIIRTRLKSNKIKLKQALLWLEDVKSISLNKKTWDLVKFNRYNFKYEPLFNLAKLFYYNSGPNLNKGDEYTFSFLVPVNQLFEKYTYEVMSRNISKNYSVKYQGPSKYLANVNNKQKFLLRPDITIFENNNIRFIIDTKYKKASMEEGKLQISQSDIYQMLAYGVRYKCNNIILIYPMFLGDNKEEVLLSEIDIESHNNIVNIKVIKIDLELDPKNLYEILEDIFKL